VKRSISEGLVMAEVLTIDEIRARHDGEWVLVGDPVQDEKLKVLAGTVLAHSKNRDDVYARAVELRPQRSAMLCFVPMPKDAIFII
jgi:hypothetical protein